MLSQSSPNSCCLQQGRGKKNHLFLSLFHHLSSQSLMSGFLPSPGSLTSAANKDKPISPEQMQIAIFFHCSLFFFFFSPWRSHQNPTRGFPPWEQLCKPLFVPTLLHHLRVGHPHPLPSPPSDVSTEARSLFQKMQFGGCKTQNGP